MHERQPCALTIAGSDSGAGAGIQADLKTFAAHGVFGTCALTLVTAQNTQGVKAVNILPENLLRDQLELISADFMVAAAKTGALGDTRVIETVSEFCRSHSLKPVVDPVMISKHGHALLETQAVEALRELLLPQALIVTPNLMEAAALTGSSEITSHSEMLDAAKRIAEFGCQAVVVKGGHSAGEPADLLWWNGQSIWLGGERVDTEHTHGTGCTFSAAITANLVLGHDIPESTRRAKQYINGALKYARRFGKGINPVNHFWRTNPSFGVVPGYQPENE